MDKLNSLEGFDSGSNYKFGDKMLFSGQSRSLFDLSHLVTMTIENGGLLVPFTLWPTLPNDDFDINVDCLLRVMPQVVPLYSRQRLYIYGFYSRLSDLYQNAQVFMDKGYTGNVEKVLPRIWKHSGNSAYSNVEYDSSDTIEPNSLFDYMGLPIGACMDDLFGYVPESAPSANINALPFMMYLRIYRDYFMNKNEWINDRVLLPDDDSRFRLNDNGQLLSALDENCQFYFKDGFDLTRSNAESPKQYDYYCGLLYHDYPDDYFNSALPFTQRGTTPKLNWNIDTSDLTATTNTQFQSIKLARMLNDSLHSDAYYPAGDDFGYLRSSTNPVQEPFEILGLDYPHPNAADYFNSSFQESLNNSVKSTTSISGSQISLAITLEDIRRLAIEQIELEQLARTDGSYRQFGLSFFGEPSKASYDYRPTYIGGTYKNIVFTEVLQTSGSTVPTTAESGNSPLGAYAGHGITGISNGRIGHIHCDDYGYIMLIACIMPDVYYSQGIDKHWTDVLQSDFYLPERAKLGLQPIYNRELYYAGNNSSSAGGDNYLWAYQNAFDTFRYLPNKIKGKIADSSNESFFPFTQSRHFNGLVNWGRNFSEAKDVRKDYLFAPSESAYSAQFSCNIRAVRPLPYKAVPAQIIN